MYIRIHLLVVTPGVACANLFFFFTFIPVLRLARILEKKTLKESVWSAYCGIKVFQTLYFKSYLGYTMLFKFFNFNVTRYYLFVFKKNLNIASYC